MIPEKNLREIANLVLDPLGNDLEFYLSNFRIQKQNIPIILEEALKKYKEQSPESSFEEINQLKNELLRRYDGLINEKIITLGEMKVNTHLIKSFLYFN
jgi:hypothetical protein